MLADLTPPGKRAASASTFGSETFVCETTLGNVREGASTIRRVIATLSVRSVCETETARWTKAKPVLRARDLALVRS